MRVNPKLANLADRADRLMLVDLLIDEGDREWEVALLRSCFPLVWEGESLVSPTLEKLNKAPQWCKEELYKVFGIPRGWKARKKLLALLELVECVVLEDDQVTLAGKRRKGAPKYIHEVMGNTIANSDDGDYCYFWFIEWHGTYGMGFHNDLESIIIHPGEEDYEDYENYEDDTLV